MGVHHTGDHSGIYSITHLTSGRVYIGSAKCIKCRWNMHRSQLRTGLHRNRFLQRAWNKYGESSFVFKVLEYCPRESLIEREQYWIDTRKSFNKRYGYNLRSLAGNRDGKGHTEETKSKLREIKRNISEDTRRRLADSHLGNRQTEETKAKIRNNSASAKLNQEIAETIRREYGPARGKYSRWTNLGKPTTTSLAKKYGVSTHTISMIVQGKVYPTNAA